MSETPTPEEATPAPAKKATAKRGAAKKAPKKSTATNSPTPDEFGRVRVTDKDTGHRRSVHVEELPHGNYTVLKADASTPSGDPLPPEYDAVKPTNGSGETTKEKSDA